MKKIFKKILHCAKALHVRNFDVAVSFSLILQHFSRERCAGDANSEYFLSIIAMSITL